jgi:iron-sulfur cluster insertion protein
MIVDPTAIARLKEILAEETTPNLKLRIFVQGGGCSGFSYGFTLDEEQQSEDFQFDMDSVSILVDSMSFQYLQGSTIKFHEDLHGSSFVIDNPNAQTTCGCGSSFAPY